MEDKYLYILKIAENDNNIRGVVLYGSRANDDIQADEYQDYDIYYIVTDIDNFDVSVFENIKLKFTPSENYPELFPDEYAYLMLFEDDSRIDLTVCTLETYLTKHINCQLTKCLLDKDNNIKGINNNDKSMYWIKPLDERLFSGTCSEFFWELQNMAKGIKRDELSYAMFIRDISLRDMLNRIIDTYIGMKNEYRVSVGTLGKYRKKYLNETEYELYKSTYISNTIEDMWKSALNMVDLFGLLGRQIADKYNYQYPNADEQYMRDYISRVMTKTQSL